MGTKERKIREKEKKHNDIIDAAEEVFFKKGLAAATMDEIASISELSKGTLYLYFETKSDLIAAVVQRGMHILSEVLKATTADAKTGVEKIGNLLNAYITFAANYPDYFNLIFKQEVFQLGGSQDGVCSKACVLEAQAIFHTVEIAIVAGKADKTIRNDLNPEKTALLLWGYIHGAIVVASSELLLCLDAKTTKEDGVLSLAKKLIIRSIENIR